MRSSTPPRGLRPWLECQSSLTEKLKHQAKDVDLTILANEFRDTQDWEKHTLACPDDKLFHREIVMNAEGKPCWYARTIIPYTTYNAETSLFDRLQNEPLGHLIYSNSSIEKVQFYFDVLSKQDKAYQWVNHAGFNDQDDALWARFSKFLLNKTHPFYLTEVFLPNFIPLVEMKGAE